MIVWLSAVLICLTVPAPANPDDAIKLVDTVSQKGLVWWLSGLSLFSIVGMYMLIRMILGNYKAVLAELRKEKADLAEQVRKDREASELKAAALNEKLLATNQRFVEQLSPVIQANTQAQRQNAEALADVEKAMREGITKVSDGMREMGEDVKKSHECCKDSKVAAESTLKTIEDVHRGIHDLLRRPPRTPR
jgi:methyl-accepting chemotaxis protein